MMKNILIFLLITLATSLFGALLYNQEYTLSQPDGSQLSCLASGDEYFSYLHDKDGYTIIRSQSDGFFYYAVAEGDKLVPSVYKVNSVDPSATGLEKGAIISREAYLERRAAWNEGADPSIRCPGTGTVNNIVIYIRFANQSEFPDDRQFFDNKFNNNGIGAESMINYYQEKSYGLLTINSHHYPISDMNTNVSYQDIYDRSYFEPYNSTTNPDGYTESQRSDREFALLARAVAAVEDQIPTSINFDTDSDNRIDNVCFIIRGGNDGWSDLLWAHRWYLMGENVRIHGKRVWDFTFQPVSQNSVQTLCHEMFHSIGAPDLYHYNSVAWSAVGSWDIMESGFGHPLAYMKWRYGGWIDNIPEITNNGTYTLNPLHMPTGNCYKIPSPNSTQEYYIVEYRQRLAGTFETNLPSSGILVTRVNTRADGEGNAQGPPDELYIFRPGGGPSVGGDVNNATFAQEYGRTAIGNNTAPTRGYLANGADAQIDIAEISTIGETMSFVFGPEEGYIDGSVSVDIPDYDYSDLTVTIGTSDFEVDSQGRFFITYNQGTYAVLFHGPGIAAYTENITINPLDLVTMNVELLALQKPYNFEYTLDGTNIELDWDFDHENIPSFNHFILFISINRRPFAPSRIIEESEYYFRIGGQLDIRFYLIADYEGGQSAPSDTLYIDYTATGAELAASSATMLLGNTPNPFNPSTKIEFNLAVSEEIDLSIYNLLGQKVITLLSGKHPQGRQTVVWDGRDNKNRFVSSGIYFYTLKTSDSISTQKMIMLK